MVPRPDLDQSLVEDGHGYARFNRRRKSSGVAVSPLVHVDPGQEDSTRSRFHDFASTDGLKGMQRFASI